MAQLLPTKGNLMQLKRSRSLAKTGFELMDKKRTILVKEMMERLDAAKELQARIDTLFRESYDALQAANIRYGITSALSAYADIDTSIEVRNRSVMGVLIPHITSEAQPPQLPYPLSPTGPALDEAFQKFYELKNLLLQLAEIETTVYRLADAIKKTQKRTNALRNIVLPSMEADMRRITDALEEKEREEYVRLKKIKK